MSSRSWSLGKSALFGAVALAAAALVNQMVGCMSAAGQARGVLSTAQVTVSPGMVAAADELIGQMSLQAGVIFAGRVAAVRRPAGFAGSGEDTAQGVVEIDFLVDESVRGPAAGSMYTLREWAGLWVGDAERYRVGQRLLMLLYGAGPGGLGSTVHGAEGAIPLRGDGAPPGPDDTNAKAAEVAVDLRWLQAQVQSHRVDSWFKAPIRVPVSGPRRGVHSEIDGGASGRIEVLEVSELARAFPGPWVTKLQATEVETQPLSEVLDLCRLRLKARDATR